MAQPSSTNRKERIIIEVAPRTKRVLDGLSILWRKSIAEIVRTCLRPIVDQYEGRVDELDELRAEAAREEAEDEVVAA